MTSFRTILSFHELTPGVHKILIVLAANNHTPLGPQETLTVTIPYSAAVCSP